MSIISGHQHCDSQLIRHNHDCPHFTLTDVLQHPGNEGKWREDIVHRDRHFFCLAQSVAKADGPSESGSISEIEQKALHRLLALVAILSIVNCTCSCTCSQS